MQKITYTKGNATKRVRPGCLALIAVLENDGWKAEAEIEVPKAPKIKEKYNG